jgi:Ser/Thr protein kinase RdoA (MazF antagonist)
MSIGGPNAAGWKSHGTGRDEVDATWAPLTDAEVASVLAGYPSVRSSGAVIWRSPRPYSAAAVVEVGPSTSGAPPRRVFVKRHHVTVRTAADLGPEHRFSDHLRTRGVPVPAVLRRADGEGVYATDEWTYEVHEAGQGEDRYRDRPSWTPYLDAIHARAAGRALGLFHRASASFGEPARPAGVLQATDQVSTATDPMRAVAHFVEHHRVLDAYLSRRSWSDALADAVGDLPDRLHAALRRRGAPVMSAWGHGDWHGSNLLWSPADPVASAKVTAVLDLGLANRTSLLFDLAVALERAAVGWLDLAEGNPPPIDVHGAVALVGGYHGEVPLSGVDREVLVAILPLVHMDFALSEVEYFSGVVGDEALADLAWDSYLLGHLRWWRTPAAEQFVADLLAEWDRTVRAP